MEIEDDINRSLDAFAKDLSREDEMGSVIRAHIHLESILYQIVEHLVPYYAHVKRMNLDYDGYVSLALASGLAEAYGPSLRAMGTLRNNFAHKLTTTLDENTVKNLYTTLSTKEKEQVHASFTRIRAEN